MASTVFYPHAIDFSDGDLITQLRNITPAYNFQDITEMSSGDLWPSYSGSLSAAPRCAFSTRQVKSILDLADASAAHGNGKIVGYNGSGGNTDVWLRKADAYGLRVDDATDGHERARLTKAFLKWDTITAQQNQAAEISCELVAGYDGVNDPLVFTQEPLSGNPAVNHLFTLGPITLNGTNLDGLQGFTWTNNTALDVVFDSGVPFPTYIGVQMFSPTITARVRNGELMRTIGSRGVAVASLIVYLRKLQVSAIAESNASSVHIAFVGAGGTAKARQVDNQGLVDVHIQLHSVTTNVSPFSFDTTSAIV